MIPNRMNRRDACPTYMRKPTEKHPEPALTFKAPENLANVTVILVEPAVPGAVNNPDELIVPPLALQVTAEL